METSVGLPNLLQKVLLACGILAALLYIGTDILAGLLSKDYHFDAQSASLLSAFGAATRPYVLVLNITADILLVAFSLGVWFSADQNWILRLMACLLAGNAVFYMVAVVFFPLHPGEPVNSPANTLNTVIMAVSVFLLLFAIGFGAAGNHDWFRYFSIGLLLLFLVLTILGLYVIPRIAAGQPVPRVGIQERTMIYAEMLWLALQAVVLLRA
jgi:Protein of unknown function (DUF998)